MKLQELLEDKKKKQEELDALEDAELAIEESMGDDLKLFVGEIMFDLDEDQATKYQEKVCFHNFLKICTAHGRKESRNGRLSRQN